MARTGVLLLGFGGPDSLDAVAPFMCNLMGREPSEELVDRVCRRYLTIGGSSPLTGIATGIAEGIEARLGQSGHSIPVRVGMRYWHPYIDDAFASLVEAGCDRIVTVSLSPFESEVTSGAYREAVADAAQRSGHLIEIVEAPLLSELPQYVEYYTGAIAADFNDIEPGVNAILVFTAHSLPESDLVADDPYEAGLRRVAEAAAVGIGMARGHIGARDPRIPGFSAYGSAEGPLTWFIAYQSKGAKPGAWLGPELDEVIEAAANSRVDALVVAPIGFMTDHMETLYDLDIVAAEKAAHAGLGWSRTPVPNDHPLMLDAIADAVKSLL